jgi:hypothetical protein
VIRGNQPGCSCGCGGGGSTNLTVFGCNALPIAGAGVSVYSANPSSGGKLLGSCITDSSGKITSACHLPSTGTVWISVPSAGTTSRFQAYGALVNVKTTHSVTLIPASGYICVPPTASNFACAQPLAATLSGTDAVLGGFFVTFSGVSPLGAPQWTGNSTYSYPACASCPSVTITLNWTFAPSQLFLDVSWSLNGLLTIVGLECPTTPGVFNPIVDLRGDASQGGPCIVLTANAWTRVNPPSTYNCPPAFKYQQTVSALQSFLNCSWVQSLYCNQTVGTLTTQTLTE